MEWRCDQWSNELMELLLVPFVFILLIKRGRFEEVDPCESPVYCQGELLALVQTMGVFEDSKTFVDMPMVDNTDIVLESFSNWTNRSKEGLLEFVNIWFNPPGTDLLSWTPTDWQEMPAVVAKIENEHYKEWVMDLNKLWREFGKEVSQSVRDFPDQHSLLAVDNPFIAPGGRFTEFYYWDSYWIIRGLLLCGMNNTVRGMIQNLAQLIDKFGFVPNGGRVYYTMRSQPPLLTWMVYEYYQVTRDTSFLREVLPYLDDEYQFWMENRSMVYTECDCTVNRYDSPSTSPRPESYREDIATASLLAKADRPELYSNLASGAESGWDFSSRWFRQSGTLSSIRTKEIIPVDLNSIIGVNEVLLGKFHSILDSPEMASMYSQAWQERKEHFDRLFWNETKGIWSDREVDSDQHLPGFYASSTTPLYMSMIASDVNVTQENIVLQTLMRLGVFDYPGGIPASLNENSEQQWDFPNAWAPLQWFLVQAWSNSSSVSLKEAARQLATTWLRSNYAGWLKFNGSMFEKYNCTVLGKPGTGGEYTVQSGFGWTNGVVIDFLNLYPESSPLSSMDSTGIDRTSTILLSIFLSLFACTLLNMFPCLVFCRWVYSDGKRKYWARVRNEQNLHSSSSDPQSPSVYENPGAREWDIDYQNVDL